MEPRTMDARCERCGGPVKRVNGAWLRVQRKNAGMSLRELGKWLGLSAGFLCDVERGKRRCSHTLAEAYAALGRGAWT